MGRSPRVGEAFRASLGPAQTMLELRFRATRGAEVTARVLARPIPYPFRHPPVLADRPLRRTGTASGNIRRQPNPAVIRVLRTRAVPTYEGGRSYRRCARQSVKLSTRWIRVDGGLWPRFAAIKRRRQFRLGVLDAWLCKKRYTCPLCRATRSLTRSRRTSTAQVAQYSECRPVVYCRPHFRHTPRPDVVSLPPNRGRTADSNHSHRPPASTTHLRSPMHLPQMLFAHWATAHLIVIASNGRLIRISYSRRGRRSQRE